MAFLEGRPSSKGSLSGGELVFSRGMDSRSGMQAWLLLLVKRRELCSAKFLALPSPALSRRGIEMKIPTIQQPPSDWADDAMLVKRFLRGFRESASGEPLWSRVSISFGVGSTRAEHICRRHGFDPDLLVKQRRL